MLQLQITISMGCTWCALYEVHGVMAKKRTVKLQNLRTSSQV